MVRKNKNLKGLPFLFSLLAVLLVNFNVSSQTVIFNETFGTSTGNPSVNAYTGWSSTATFSSNTADLRTTSVSTGYLGASGSSNVMLNSIGEYLAISNINTSGYTSISLTLGIRKGTNSETGSNLSIEVSEDGTVWIPATYSLPTTSSGWFFVTPTVVVPATSNLRMRFTNHSAVEFRLDDITLKGTPSSTPFAVNFSVINANGTLGAQVDGSDIATGDLVQSGKNVVFTAVPAVGFRVKEWKLNTVAVAGNTTNSYTITNLTEASGVTVEFEAIPSYIVNFSVFGANGTISATVDGVAITTGDLVPAGKNVIFTAVPAVNYRVKEWKLNTVIIAGNTANTDTLLNLQAASAVTVEFELAPSYVVNFGVVAANGSIAATVDAVAITTGISVLGGKNIVFTATPDALYQVKEWKLNTAVVAGNTTNTYTISGLSEISTVSVEFELIPVASGSLIISQYIEATSGIAPKAIELWNKTGVTIDFATTNLIIKQGSNGGAPAVATTINTGTLANNAILVVGTSDVKTFSEANGATFKLFAFAYNGNDALEIWLGTVKQDVFGTPGTDPGSAWSGNGVSTLDQNISLIPGITTASLTGWSNPSLRFETISTTNALTGFGLAPVIPVYHAVSFSVAGTNGSISASVNSVSINSGDNVVEGKNVVFTATPLAGYRVKEWTLNTVAVSGNTTNSFTITNLTAASVVTVEFEAIPTYIVNFSVVGTNGTISATVDGVAIATGDLVTAGKNVIFTAVPAAGYRVDKWTLNTAIVAGNISNTDTLLNIQAISTVTVEFIMIPTYAVTYSVVAANGALTAMVDAAPITSGALILGGKNIVFTATPDALYQVKEWKLNSILVPANTTNTYTITNLSEISTVSVEFELIPAISGSLIISQYIETSSGTTPKAIELWNKTGVTIDFATTNLIIKQGSNGGAPAVATTINTGTLANNAILVVGTSDVQTFSVANGAIFKLFAFNFNGNDALEIWLGTVKQDVFGTPGTDPVSAWTGNGVSTANQNISLIPGITTPSLTGWSDPSIRFEKISTDNSLTGLGLPPVTPVYHVVDFSVAGSNGSISATVNTVAINSGDNVMEGRNVLFTATPAAGYRVKEWKLNTVAVVGNITNTFTITNITAASVVTVEFEAIPTYIVNFSAVGTNGTISATVDGVAIATGDLVTAGKNVVFTAAPAPGYRVDKWTLNTAIIAGNTSNTDTLLNIQAISTVTVEFIMIPTYAVTYSVVSANGNLTAMVDAASLTSGTSVLEGKTVDFTAVPATGYRVKEWKLNTVVVTGNTTNAYTIASLSEISTVSVEFELIPTYTVTFTVKNSAAVNITDAVVTFNGVANAAGNYVFTNVAAGSYSYSVVAPGYLALGTTNVSVTADATVPVVLLDLPAPATLPIYYSGPWQTGLATGWSQTGLGTYTTDVAAKFDGTGDVLTVNFNSSPDSLFYEIKANPSGSTPWSGTFDVSESIDGVLWTSVVSYSATNVISTTATTVHFNLLPTSRWVRWIYTTKVSGNVSIDNVYITKEPTFHPVNFAVVGVNGTVSATVDGTPITTGALVQEGKDVIFTAVPNSGFKVKEWVNNTVVTGVTTNSYTLTNLVAPATVSVDFEVIPTFAVNFSVVGTDGTITATVDGTPITTGALVQEGKTVIFTAVPNIGFNVKEWVKNTVVVTGETTNIYTLTNLVAATTVTVEFKALPAFAVNFSVIGSNGTLTAKVDGLPITTGDLVQEGKNVVFTAAPSALYLVKEWKLNSIVVTGNTTNSYTLSNVSAISTVNVEFKVDATEINDAKKVVVNIYPNPSTGLYNVTSNNSYNVDVVDVLGKIVFSQNIQNGQTTLNLSSVNNGIYFVRFTNANESFVVKIKKIN